MDMMKTGAAELREAAARAREFARLLPSRELKESFMTLASKWEAEAQRLKAQNQQPQN